MGYTYFDFGQAAPFVPSSLAFPKKKAKQLRDLVDDVSLSLAQQTIAKALGWKDWFALNKAITSGQTPSLPDEDVPEDEQQKRWSTQFQAIHQGLNLRLPDPEFIVADLGLTCSRATAKKRLKDIGPWGAYQSPPKELAPGLWYGECAKFFCYRLSRELQSQIPPAWRLDTHGWYMDQDHEWRVVLSFPHLFSEKDRERAWSDMSRDQPLLYELATGKVPADRTSRLAITIAARKNVALSRPNDWFALSHFPHWSIAGRSTALTSNQSLTVISAIRGKDLVRLIDNSGVWPTDNSIHVGWFAATINDFIQRCRFPLPGLEDTSAATCISGMPGYEHPPVSPTPFKIAPFDAEELSWDTCAGYEALINTIESGSMAPIE